MYYKIPQTIPIPKECNLSEENQAMPSQLDSRRPTTIPYWSSYLTRSSILASRVCPFNWARNRRNFLPELLTVANLISFHCSCGGSPPIQLPIASSNDIPRINSGDGACWLFNFGRQLVTFSGGRFLWLHLQDSNLTNRVFEIDMFVQRIWQFVPGSETPYASVLLSLL